MGVHYQKADVLFRQRRYEQAERELREELAESPYSGVGCDNPRFGKAWGSVGRRFDLRHCDFEFSGRDHS
jgi:hypothetical protein